MVPRGVRMRMAAWTEDAAWIVALVPQRDVRTIPPCMRRERRCAAAYGDVDVLVFGHSHIPWDTTADTGLRLLNPGSPTDRRRQPHCTYMTTTVEDGALGEVLLHRLPRR